MHMVISGSLLTALMFAWGFHAGNKWIMGGAILMAFAGWLGNYLIESQASVRQQQLVFLLMIGLGVVTGGIIFNDFLQSTGAL